jgi:hypothetical protein
MSLWVSLLKMSPTTSLIIARTVRQSFTERPEELDFDDWSLETGVGGLCVIT